MFDLQCDRDSGFLMDPNDTRRYGFVTAVNGFGLASALASDLAVSVVYNAGAAPIYAGLTSTYVAPALGAFAGTARVVGVIERFTWNGGSSDPIGLDFCVSAANAERLRALQLTSKTTAVSALGWWIADYDQEVKKWFEQAFPGSHTRVKGKIFAPAKTDIRLVVGATSVPTPNPDLFLAPVRLEVAPIGDTGYALHFASSESQKILKNWGLVVGTT